MFAELTYCGRDEDNTVFKLNGVHQATQTELGPLYFKETAYEPIAFNDSDVGLWTFEAVLLDNSDIENTEVLRRTTFFIDVVSPC